MILVTLGTQDKSFVRLLKEVDRQIELGNIKDKVVVQAGFTKYSSPNMEIFDLIDRDKFNDLMSECSLLITHGGVGSILTGLKNNKKVIAVPRLSKYDEHVNDHQIQIIERFSEMGHILSLFEDENLEDKLKEVKNFVPKEYVSNTKNLIGIIDKFINKF